MKITKKYLQRIIGEEINEILNEYDSPRDAHMKGSKYAGAGKFIEKGGKEAFRKKQCKKSWEIHGQWVQGMGDCADLLHTSETEHSERRTPKETPTGRTTGNWQKDTEDRLDEIERRLNAAGIPIPDEND